MEELIDNYYTWYREECSDPWYEMVWLINCALSSETQRDNVIEVLKDVMKYKENR